MSYRHLARTGYSLRRVTKWPSTNSGYRWYDKRLLKLVQPAFSLVPVY